MPRRKSQLQDELRQQRPFATSAQELTIGVLRTAGVVRRELDRGLDGSGLSGAQYNVLRIVRGAGADGLPTLTVRDRLIEAAPGVTRLVGKLERAGFLVRARTTADRRQVICRITPAGLALLAALEPRVHAAIERVGSRLSAADRKSCVALLDVLRRDDPRPR
jgi:MarR family transcriptional regulator, organic hydroperoxide resistance regulator